MNSRDRLVVAVADAVMRLATDQTRARVLVALYRAQHRHVSEALLARAAFPATGERIP